MVELVFVKLGGSIITDKLRAASPRPKAIERLAYEVKRALECQPGLSLVLGHGSGSFGHVPGARYGVRQGITDDDDWWGYAATGAAAGRLNRIVTDALLDAGVPVLSVQPSASAHCRAGRLHLLETTPIRRALQHRLVPLVYGDVAFDELWGCTIVSTEDLFAYLARELRPARIVMVGQVDGVYDRDPAVDRQAVRIPRITPQTFDQVQAQLRGSHGVDVTGGMLSKVREMVSVVAQGYTARVHLISGERPEALYQVLLDPGVERGTIIER